MKRLTSFFSMKKFVLGALACAALVLMMPGEAKANVLITRMVSDINANVIGNGCSWNDSTKTLELNGATIAVNDVDGIYLTQAATINLVGDNAITVNTSGAGINVYGDLTITGSGKLTIEVDNGCGIIANGELIINGVTIEITDTAAHANSKIYAFQSGISIINSNVTINGKSNSGGLGNGNGNGLDTLSGGEIKIENSELYIKIESTGSHHCLEPGKDGDLNRKLFIEPAANLKVTYTQDSDPITIKDPITVSQKNILCADGTKEVRITYGRSSAPGTPSDNKSDDKKNESSPFHKFETSSIKEAKASGKIDATGGWKSFDRGTLNELSKLGKDISVTYDFNGHTYCVVVPKGFDPQKLVNEEGYCGFLYLAKVYGAVMIK